MTKYFFTRRRSSDYPPSRTNRFSPMTEMLGWSGRTRSSEALGVDESIRISTIVLQNWSWTDDPYRTRCEAAHEL
jgi:hypothetical protein